MDITEKDMLGKVHTHLDTITQWAAWVLPASFPHMKMAVPS